MALIKGSRRVGLGARNTRMQLLSAFQDARIVEFPATTTLPDRPNEVQYVVRIDGEERVLIGTEVEPYCVGLYDALRMAQDPRAEAVAAIVGRLTVEADRLPTTTAKTT